MRYLHIISSAQAERALQADNSVESCEDALGACLEESDQILGMLNTLMDISEAETGTVKLNKQVVKASTIIERIIDLYRYIAEERNIIIEYNVHDDLYINVDPKIEQAFSNLIDNAIKYSPDGGRIDLEAFKGNKEVIFRVRDGGIGIPEEELPRIWDRLFRGKHAFSQRGLGLGLNLVKAIVEAHKGRIDVSSELGKGSEFRIILPSI